MTEQTFELTFNVFELAAGQSASLAGDEGHHMVYVENGAAVVNSTALDAGDGRYCDGACEMTASSAARLACWTLVAKDKSMSPPVSEVARQSQHDIELAPGTWVMRLDTVEFPAGSRAHRHDHSGAGTRYLLQGSLEIVSDHDRTMMRPGDPWFEGTRSAVLAIADENITSKFVRVMILPEEDLGKRTINYLDRADDDKPRLQSNTRMVDQVIVIGAGGN
jgi:quercetin dioxygenase-like cupin family protein